MKRILLDTNAYIKFLQGEKSVLDALSAAETVYLSVIVIGELLSGFKGGTKERQNRERLNAFLLKSTVKTISVTPDTAEFYSNIKDALRRKGTPIPQNDIWIAAHTMESGSMLVTYDSHFSMVNGLIIRPH
ncbi:MAG: type II toxin-antitoxin system VapC family toxin [Chitinispirillaceae bacterium]|nr:type II toxin-antitoxin system VapC family toxin [Chitinispirillaceae bacterium]